MIISLLKVFFLCLNITISSIMITHITIVYIREISPPRTLTPIPPAMQAPACVAWVVSAVGGNNEVSMVDMETQSRHMTLWASPKPPLSTTQVL